VAEREAPDQPRETRDIVERLARAVALAGGFIALGVAILVTASIIRRRMFGQPIPGDFEFVQMATAVAVFTFLPLCQAHRGNIAVDTFTSGLPARWRRRLDALWDLVYAGFMALLAIGLGRGALEAAGYGTTTMVLQLPIWPAIAASALLSAVLSLLCVWTAARLVRGPP
jgi:TRAP-type C4-dicarboxylate transport system permease small subunit